MGDLTAAVRAEGLKMGLYHGFTFNEYDQTYPHFPYVAKIHAQVKELIDRYNPDIFWPDSYWKPKEKSSALQWRSKDVIAYFYNHAARPEEVLVNDRCGKEENDLLLGDFSTPEYAVLPDKTDFYWELTRGIGESYGYKQTETENEYLSVPELVRSLSMWSARMATCCSIPGRRLMARWLICRWNVCAALGRGWRSTGTPSTVHALG